MEKQYSGNYESSIAAARAMEDAASETKVKVTKILEEATELKNVGDKLHETIVAITEHITPAVLNLEAISTSTKELLLDADKKYQLLNEGGLQ